MSYRVESTVLAPLNFAFFIVELCKSVNDKELADGLIRFLN